MTLRLAKGIALLSATACLLSVGGVLPACADSTFDRLDRAVRHDLDVIHRDESRLHDLYHKRDDQHYRSDWRGERDTNKRIDHARLDL